MRLWLVVGRDVFKKHPHLWTQAEFEQARDFAALHWLEREEEAERWKA